MELKIYSQMRRTY